MAQGALQQQLNYWRCQLEGLQSLQLPTDFPRSGTERKKLEGEQVKVHIPLDVSRRLKELASANGATLFCSLFALFAATLGRYGNTSDVAAASVVSTRERAELDPVIGYFVNTLIFRVKLAGSFSDLIRQVKD